jgi:glycosyltransferase involved in cell wall biosynthesis
LALGILKQGWLFKVCDRINKALLREADAVVAIGQQMAVHLRVLVGNPRRLEVIHNWADGNRIRPKDRTQQPGLADRLGIREVFTVLYAGNMGLAQEIDALICLLRACKDRQDIQFLFVGGGVRRRDLIEAAATDRLTNVAFVSYQDRSDLSDLLALADIGVVTLTPALEGLAIPTRTYSYLAADLPLLAISGPNSELKLFAEDGLGAHFTPDAIEQMVQYLDTQIRQGRRARDNRYRRHFAKHFDRQGQTAKYIALLNTIPPPGQS